MSVQKEIHIVYGYKLDEKFTELYWESELYETHEFQTNDDKNFKFLSDGMNGDYTFYGYIEKIHGGWVWEEEDKIIDLAKLPSEKSLIEFFEFYFSKDYLLKAQLFYVPHYT